MQDITLEQVKRAAFQYYCMGRLTAQHPDQDKRECVYIDGEGYRCAVGAVFTEETIALHDAEFGRGTGCSDDVDALTFVSMPAEERRAIAKIQDAYDMWCAYSWKGSDRSAMAASRGAFLALIAPSPALAELVVTPTPEDVPA